MWARCRVTRDGITVTSNAVRATWAASQSTSTRQRTFYRLATSTPSAPTSSAFNAYTSPGGGWSTSRLLSPTNAQAVYQVTLTQSFNHATTQTSATFTGNAWSSVSVFRARTGGGTADLFGINFPTDVNRFIGFTVNLNSPYNDTNTSGLATKISGPTLYHYVPGLQGASGQYYFWFYGPTLNGVQDVTPGTYVFEVVITRSSDQATETARKSITIS